MYKIDSHHHFWIYDPAEYQWIGDDLQSIRRDFGPPDLEAEMVEAGVDAVISVQARQTLEETHWLLNLANEHDYIKGVVGWVPLINPDLERLLPTVASHPKLKAVRHVLHDEADADYMLRSDFNRGLGALKPYPVAYDLLIFESHLPQTIQLVDRHPNQIFVVDHLAKPRVKAGELSPWRENLRELAQRPHVYCKLSGLVTEADWSAWTEASLHPYIETVLTAFEPRRVMFGSDWPVCLVASTYKRWVEVVKNAIASLSEAEQQRIWSGTAVEAYRL